ncbi:hypothetical protein Tco_0213940 [Tanacetum coccineum]
MSLEFNSNSPRKGELASSLVKLKCLLKRLILVHPLDMAPLPHHDLRHPWLRYQVDGYDEDGMRQTLGDRLSMVYVGDDGEALFTSLHSEDEMVKPGFGAYWSGSERVILDKGDLRDYWIEISSDMDFLGPALSYVHIRDPMRRLCYRMIACSISGRGQGAEKVIRVDLSYLWTMDRRTANVPYLLAQYLFHHAEGRKSGARLSVVVI